MASILGSAPRLAPAGATLRRPALQAVALALVGILAAHFDTAASIVAIWWRSETYAHGFVVLPICAWLAWQKRHALAATPAMPWLPALAFVAAAGALWFVMSIGDVLGVRQFALLFMLQAAIVAVVGLRVARVAAFPIAFMVFAVPFGEFMIPTLIEWTADFTVAALRMSGVPVYREANHFVIPSGAWSVVEACSGLRYLIASVMIGVVYAAVTYRSAWRRTAFIAASVLVPIVANWLRAYLIVMTGHLSDNTLAVGVDHLIYGWVFFGVVMAILFWIGSFWSEPTVVATTRDAGAVAPVHGAASRRCYAAAVAAIVAAALWRPLYAALDPAAVSPVPVLPSVSAAGGFVPVADDPLPWTPSYGGHVATLRQTFARGDAAVTLYVAYYRNQSKGRELVTSGNQLTLPQDFQWKLVREDEVEVRFAGTPTTAVRAEIAGARERVVAYRVYWVDGVATSSRYAAKARLAWSKLRGRGDDAALVVLFTRAGTEDATLGDAVEALSPGIVRSLESAEGRR